MIRCPICGRTKNEKMPMIYKAIGGKWCIWHFCKNGMSVFSGGHTSEKSAIKFWDKWAK